MNWNKKHIDLLDDELRRKQRNGEHDSLDRADEDAMEEARKDLFLLKSALRLEQMKENKKFLDEHRTNQTKNHDISRLPRRRLVIGSLVAAAAVVLALILFMPGGIGPFTQPEISNQYLADNFDGYILHDGFRSNQDAPVGAEELAYSMFATKKFDDAIPLLEQLWDEQNDQLALYYLILSHTALGEDSTARDLFASNRASLTPEMIDLIERIY